MTIHIIPLADLGVTDDPGTTWHPDKPEAYDAEGHLLDVVDVEEHLIKPEALWQADAGVEPLSAEDSLLTPDGEI